MWENKNHEHEINISIYKVKKFKGEQQNLKQRVCILVDSVSGCVQVVTMNKWLSNTHFKYDEITLNLECIINLKKIREIKKSSSTQLRSWN